MKSIKKGIKQIVENCLKVKPKEKVVIITDKKTLKISSAIKKIMGRITGDIQLFIMEDFGERPLSFPDQIGEVLKKADISLYIAQGVKKEFQTFRKSMLEIINTNKKLRHAHMIGITKKIMKDGMCSDYQKIQRTSKLVYQRIHKAKEIRVITNRGTNITAQFGPEFKWIICDGNISAGNWSNLPDGEVFTCPININGKVIIDGCLGSFFSKKYGSLKKNPVTIEIENGRAKKESIQCDNRKLEKELIKWLFETDENSSKVGEFAIGTNTGLKKLIGNLLQDEKFPGVHIAFGSPYPMKTGAKWDSKVHIDAVIKDTTIYVDGEVIMTKGKFLFL